MIFPSVFCIVVGAGMMIQWAISLFSGNVLEIHTEPIRIAFHLAAEAATAVMLLLGGIGLLAAEEWSRTVFYISMGMLFYTAVVSPGYFAQKGNWVWVGIFAVLIFLGIISITIVS